MYYSNKLEDIKIKYLSTIKAEKMKLLNYFEQLEVQGQIYFEKIEQLAIGLINIGITIYNTYLTIGNPLQYVTSSFTSSS